MKEIIDIFEGIIKNESLVKLVFGSPRKKSLPYAKAVVRPIILKKELSYQIEYHYKSKVVHENISKDNLIDICSDLIIKDFKQINIFTTDEEIQILAANPYTPKITKKAMERNKPTLEHNKQKNYILAEGKPFDLLIRLGVTDEKGKVFKSHYNKFRQINRFLEIVDDSFETLCKNEVIRIIDFGCGKSYLTFALYHYFVFIKKCEVEIIGLDLKSDVIDHCNQIASDLKYDKLHFILGDIASYESDSADMVVSLHACDTATDYALINAVKWDTRLILSVPCCQHELFNKIDEDINNQILKHGLLKDRYTKILTNRMCD